MATAREKQTGGRFSRCYVFELYAVSCECINKNEVHGGIACTQKDVTDTININKKIVNTYTNRNMTVSTLLMDI